MRTLADFKRAMKLGTRWDSVNHYYGGQFGVRTVAKANSVGFGFETVRPDGTTAVSHCDWPKADNIEFGEDGSVKIFTQWRDDPRFHLLTYKQIEVCNG